MRILLVTAVAIATLGGCTTPTLSIEENSVIPDESLVEAYAYAEQCLGAEEEENITPFSPETRSCVDDMFILYAEANYTVVESGPDGRPSVICQSDSIDEINDCMAI